MSQPVLEENEGGIATLTLNRPDLRNPISDPDVLEALITTMSRLDADINTRVIILTGAGSAFSSGGNLKTMGKGAGMNDPLPAQTRRNYRLGIQRLPVLFEALEIPVIAAVNGHAIGAGCDLACMCDIRIAGESALFAESFVKLGIIPGDGGAWLLPRVMAFSKACELAFTGDTIDANEALACGLVSKVVPDKDLLTEARALARKIAANPPYAVRMTKRLMREARHSRLEPILEMSASMQALAHATPDHDEALSVLLNKQSSKSR